MARVRRGKPVCVEHAWDPLLQMHARRMHPMDVVQLAIFVWVELVPTLRPPTFVREKEPKGFVARLLPVLLGIVLVLLRQWLLQ